MAALPYLVRVAFTARGPCTAEFRRHIETLVGRTVKAFQGVTVQSVECGPACPCCDEFALICGCSWSASGDHRCLTHSCQVPA